MQFQGSFKVTLSPQDSSGDFGQMGIDKAYSGDFVGTGKGTMIAFRSSIEGSAGYVALESVSGSMDGKAGTFVLQHSGHSKRGDARLDLDIVADSGTDGFSSISGTGEIIREADGAHRYVFDVEFDE